MHRTFQRRLAVCFVGFLALVAVLSVAPPVFWKLRGVVEESPRPVFTWASLRSGAAMRATEEWFNTHIGLRTLWVRIDNQLNFSLFRETTARAGRSQVVSGPGDWLFERHYLAHTVTPGKLSEARLREILPHIRSVQDKLARRGIPLLIVFAPNKADIYPERAPQEFFAGRRPEDYTTDFERARPLLKEYGINFYDGSARFKEWKKSFPDNLYPRSGTHWSYQSVYHVANDLRTWLNPRMTRPIPELKLAQLQAGAPRQEDYDLLGLLNLVTAAPYEHPTPFPEMVPQTAVPTEQLPRLLWIYDSFGWMPIKLLYSANALRPAQSFYYFSSTYDLPAVTLNPLQPKTQQWETKLKDYDAVVFVLADIAVEFIGWDFFELLDRQLPPLPPARG